MLAKNIFLKKKIKKIGYLQMLINLSNLCAQCCYCRLLCRYVTLSLLGFLKR